MRVIEGLSGKSFGLVVGAVTVHDQRILFLRRSWTETFLPGQWALPAGKVKYREDPTQAVLRELYEEAGIAGQVRESIGASWFDSTYYGHELHSIQLNYIVHAADPAVRLLDGSNIDYRWISLADLADPPIDFDDFTREVIDQARGRWDE